jgi:hypothetical protein
MVLILGCGNATPDNKVDKNIKSYTVLELWSISGLSVRNVKTTGFLALRAEVSFKKTFDEKWTTIRIYNLYEDAELKGKHISVYVPHYYFKGFPTQRDFLPMKKTLTGDWRLVNGLGPVDLPAHSGLFINQNQRQSK